MTCCASQLDSTSNNGNKLLVSLQALQLTLSPGSQPHLPRWRWSTDLVPAKCPPAAASPSAPLLMRQRRQMKDSLCMVRRPLLQVLERLHYLWAVPSQEAAVDTCLMRHSSCMNRFMMHGKSGEPRND
jgi:hypothetical protein